MTVRQWAKLHNRDAESEAAQWNPAIIKCIIYICASPTVTCQSIFCRKRRTGHLGMLCLGNCANAFILGMLCLENCANAFITSVDI